MASIVYQMLMNHIGIDKANLLHQLVEYTIDVLRNHDDSVCKLECINILETLAKHGAELDDVNRKHQQAHSDSASCSLSLGSPAVLLPQVTTDDLDSGDRNFDKIITDICFPIFRSAHFEKNVENKKPIGSNNRELFYAACKLCVTCLTRGTNRYHTKALLYNLCIESLQAYVEEQHFNAGSNGKCASSDEVINIFAILEILHVLFDSNIYRNSSAEQNASPMMNVTLDQDWLDTCFNELLNVVEHCEDPVCGQVAVVLLPKLLNCFYSKNINEKVMIIWRRTTKLINSNKYIHDEISKSSNCFIIMCAFIDYYLPSSHLTEKPDNLPAILSENIFWEVIQNGFSKGDGLTRKRALYLMKRAVDFAKTVQTVQGDNTQETDMPLFHWNPQNQTTLEKIWSDIILMLETLEEIQVHVVMPVMPRLFKLIEATHIPTSGWPLLHTSWIATVLERLFQHATKTICKWGVMQTLSLDYKTCPILTQVGAKFVLGPVLDVLSDYTLYIKTTEKTHSRFSSVTDAMLGFFTSCTSSLPIDKAKEFLQQILVSIAELRTKPIPLGFLCQSLVQVPPCKAWGNASMQCLRELLSSNIATITPLHRGAIQCFLMESALNLMDTDDVTLQQLSSTLAVISHDECLQRGTSLWTNIVHWLELNATDLKHMSESLFEALTLVIAEYMTVDAANVTLDPLPMIEAVKVARILLLMTDANSSARKSLLEGQSFSDLIQPVWLVLQRIGSHIYLPVAKADKALQLLVAILDEADPITKIDNDTTLAELHTLIDGCIEEICLYLRRKMTVIDETERIDEERLQLYMSVLEHIWYYLHQQQPNQVPACLQKLLEGCIPLLSSRHLNVTSHKEVVRFIYVSRILAWAFSLAVPSSNLLKTSLVKLIGPVDVFIEHSLGMVGLGETLKCSDRGSLINVFLSSKWTSIAFIIQECPHGSIRPEDVMQACLEDLAISQGLAVLPMMQCVKHLVAMVVSTPSICLEAFNTCWSVVRDSENDQRVYWPCLEAYIHAVFQKEVIKSNSDLLVTELNEIANALFVVGENKQGLVNLLAKEMSAALTALAAEEETGVCVPIMLRYLDIIMNFHLFCPALFKDIRLLQDVSVSIVEMGNDCSVNQVLKCCNRDHRMVRVMAINMIVQFQMDFPQILEDIAPHMVKSLLLRDSKEVSSRKYVCNSYRHKVKEKVWQTILLLLPSIRLDHATEILPPIIECLDVDNQTSVRYLQEWVVIVLMNQFPQFQDRLWHLLELCKVTDNWNRSQVCSLLTVLTHLGAMTSDAQLKAEFYKKALPLVLTFCLSKNFSIQLYAQASLSRLWAECKSSGIDDVLAMYPVIGSCVEFQNSSSVHFSILDRIQANFFLLNFNPQHDCNFETIFYTIPYLTLMMPEQLIPVDMFIEENAALWARSDLAFHLRAPADRQQLKELEPGAWKATKTRHNHQINAGQEMDLIGSDDVQKKIIPTGESIPGLDSDTIHGHGLDSATIHGRNQNRSELILVTSLVNKLPNLGGLSRTCEIFGVGTVVMANVSVTETKEFQNLSVTAQKWLNLEQVQPYKLKEYLLLKRQEGYQLAGVEQTANSKCLTEYKFQKKTLLLLGNERSGIPVELINILDVCVEIPQLGVLRSLNVHVSGALTVWEYTKQCMM